MSLKNKTSSYEFSMICRPNDIIDENEKLNIDFMSRINLIKPNYKGPTKIRLVSQDSVDVFNPLIDLFGLGNDEKYFIEIELLDSNKVSIQKICYENIDIISICGGNLDFINRNKTEVELVIKYTRATFLY